MKRIHTHYDNLKVARNAPPEVIRAAYKSLSQKYHPDRNPNNSEAAKIMVVINQAYDVLFDPEKRRKHDLWIKKQEEHIETNNSSHSFKETSSQNIEFHPSISGSCQFDDLPKEAREKIIERIIGSTPDQLRIKLDGVGWSYFWLVALFSWFAYLFSDATDYRWGEETNYWHIGFTCGVAILIAKNIEWIYAWHSTPLRSFLVISPLYVIKTRLDKLWFWPIWTISDIKATHNYRNGVYQGTSLLIYFDGKPESIYISPESAYQSLLNYHKTFDSKFREAVNQNNINYLVANDDFLGYRFQPINPKQSDNNKKKLLIYISTLFISLIGYGVAYNINIDRPEKSYQASTYRSPQSYTRARPTENTRYIRPATAPNGEPWPALAEYINGFERFNTDGLSTVTIDNSQNDSDVFAKLVSFTGEKAYPVRVFFIPSHGQFTLNKVRAGNYDVRYRDLDTGALSRSEPFVLQEIPIYDGTQYSNITMTLYKIQNGNMQTYGISESEF